jgi:beta-lactamase regulating signal transducer with metallopeptidase domain
MTLLLQIGAISILELTLSASVIVLVLILVKRIGRYKLHPRIMRYLWLVLLVKLLLPFSLPSPASIENWTDVYLYEKPYGVNKVLTAAASGWYELGKQWDKKEKPRTTKVYKEGQIVEAPVVIQDEETLRSGLQVQAMNRVLTAMGAVWLSGCAIYGVRVFIANLRMRRSFAGGLECGDGVVLQLLERCKAEAGVKGRVRLVKSGCIFPALYGVCRPRIILPYDYKERYEPAELRCILLHELLHYKQRDHAVYQLAALLQILHWFNPLVHLAMRMLREDMEVCCDFLVAQRLNKEERVGYGMLLIKQGEYNYRPVGHSTVTVHFFQGSSSLKERIIYIAKQAASKPSRRQLLTTAVLLLVLAAVFLPGGTMYSERKAYFRQPATLYAFWIEEGADVRSMEVISSMSEQMAGIAGPDQKVICLMKERAEPNLLERFKERMLPSSIMRWDTPQKVQTALIRDAVEARELYTGSIWVIENRHYSTTRLLSFSVSKNMLLDISSLKQLDTIMLY